jgi:hypothetical protein
MATDYYPQEEGAVWDAQSYILPCYPDGAISEVSSVKPGTTVAGRISVIVSAALGDGIGIALRASTGAGAPTRIPILFYGVCKVTTTANVSAMGEFFMNHSTTTFSGATGCGTVQYAATCLKVAGGGSYIMGMALQADAAGSGEILLLVGKTS